MGAVLLCLLHGPIVHVCEEDCSNVVVRTPARLAVASILPNPTGGQQISLAQEAKSSPRPEAGLLPAKVGRPIAAPLSLHVLAHLQATLAGRSGPTFSSSVWLTPRVQAMARRTRQRTRVEQPPLELRARGGLADGGEPPAGN